jgi:hypothetical protein
MARKMGAVVALMFLVMMVLGAVFLSTPFGQKALGFADDMKSFASPGEMTSCMTGGCQMPSMGMSMFS